MNPTDGDDVALSGSWLYGGSARAQILIVRRPTRFGTGDHEDPPNIANDQDMEAFEVLYGSPADANQPSAGGGVYATLDQARSAAEAACGASVRWEKAK